MSAPTSVGCSATYPALQEHTAASHPWGIIVRTRLAYPLLLGRLSAATLISTSGGDIRTRLPRQILARPQSQRQKIKHHQTPPCSMLMSVVVIYHPRHHHDRHVRLHSPSSLWSHPSFLHLQAQAFTKTWPADTSAFSKCLCCCVLLCAKHVGSMRRVFRTVP